MHKALKPNSHPLHIGNTTLQLFPQNAIFWEEENTLLVADVHLGKEHVFAHQGIAIPEGPSKHTLDRLSQLLNLTRASECIVLGDFFHNTPSAGDSWLQSLVLFLDKHPTVIVRISAGNHDKICGQATLDERIVWHNEPIHRGAFVLQHEPGTDERGHVLAGHIHPVVSIRPKYRRGRSMTGPCFWHQKRCTVLPAFGSFTGGFKIKPTASDSIYLTGPDTIVQIPVNAVIGSIVPSKNASNCHISKT